MKKSKNKVRRFINYLYSVYDVPRIPIHVHWYYPALVTEECKFCFGVLFYGENYPTEIHVAGKAIKTKGVLSTISHEFVHYLQYLNGRDMDDTEQIERDAEMYGEALLLDWLYGYPKEYKLKAWKAWDHEPQKGVPE